MDDPVRSVQEPGPRDTAALQETRAGVSVAPAGARRPAPAAAEVYVADVPSPGGSSAGGAA